MFVLTVQKTEDTLSIALPEDLVKKMNLEEGERLFLQEVEQGVYCLKATVFDFDVKMELAEDIINRYRNTLTILAQ